MIFYLCSNSFIFLHLAFLIIGSHIVLNCTGWNDKIVILKKTTLQLYFKTFIKKSIQATWLCSRADIYLM